MSIVTNSPLAKVTTEALASAGAFCFHPSTEFCNVC